MNVVGCFSEPVPPSGGLQAQGLVNLLGAPPMDALTLVLREAAQNAWDARIDADSPSMLVRYRTLNADQSEELRSFLLLGADRSGEPAELDSLSARLRSGGLIPVLEICDFGTEGLSGSPDPVLASSRFVRFFFDIGSPHFDGSTGGTYGFGRASLYLAGEARTIVVDSQPAGPGSPRRFMACRLGESFIADTGPNRGKRHTGRHFWGCHTGDNSVGPIEGVDATAISRSLGMPERDSKGQTGTSILIPWPQIEADAAPYAIPAVLYHHLWPKLVQVDGKTPMSLRVDVGSGEEELSLSNAHPVYECFAAALVSARMRRPPAVGIGPKNRRLPVAHVGALAAPHIQFESGPEDAEWPDPLARFRSGLSHVALMRASELVVTYRRVDVEGDAPPWVGVVLAEAAPEIASAFAAAEPPAHDDWNPDKLKGSPGTIVRMTLKYLGEGVRKCLGVVVKPDVTGSDAPSLASAADLFAGQFMAGDGTGAAATGGGRSGGSARRIRRVSVPEFLGFEISDGVTLARYSVDYGGSDGPVLEAIPSVAIEGGTTSELPVGMAPPEVLEWRSPSGRTEQGARCPTEGKGTYEFVVAYGGTYAVTVHVDLGEAE